MKKDPADNGKPPIGTFLQNFAKALPEVAERCVLGCDKYEPFDWRQRDEQYFIEKLSRHWCDCVEDLHSECEDGLSNLSAVAFHALCLIYKIHEAQPKSNEDDLPQEPLPFGEWYETYKLPRYGFIAPSELGKSSTSFEVQDLYQEYLDDFKSQNFKPRTRNEP